jgi:Domain of unknown function (DUF4838)
LNAVDFSQIFSPPGSPGAFRRTRREFLGTFAGGAALCALPDSVFADDPERPIPRETRGVVLVPEDLSLADWPERAKNAGLTTIGIHHQHSPGAVIRWVKSDAGQRFLEQSARLGLAVEYELHAMRELLPRTLFAKNPEFFRMDDKGERRPDSNCCVHSDRALEIIGENAVEIARTLRPTTGRYFYWGDDGQPWCQCPRCRELSPSEQAVVIENRICTALRKGDPRAGVAHLAYLNTLAPPEKTRPDEGIFLEYAPINRRYDIPYDQQRDAKKGDGLDALDANLKVFPKETAQVLEYWLDVSRFSHWKRPAVKLPWNREVILADVKTYRQRGIRHITNFAVWIDADYEQHFGALDFINEFGAGLQPK